MQHGGRSNAYTSSEDTNYQFDVNAEFLEEALDRFAQFFIGPLLSEDATSREIKAVDSGQQIIKFLVRSSGPCFRQYGTY